MLAPKFENHSIDPLPLALMEPRRRPRSGATKVDDKAISFLANTSIFCFIVM